MFSVTSSSKSLPDTDSRANIIVVKSLNWNLMKETCGEYLDVHIQEKKKHNDECVDY